MDFEYSRCICSRSHQTHVPTQKGICHFIDPCTPESVCKVFSYIIVTIVSKHLVVIYTSIFNIDYGLSVFYSSVLRLNRICGILIRK